VKKPNKILKQGLIHKDNNRYQDAIKFFKQVLSKKPDHLDANIHMGDCLRCIGKIDEAYQYFKIALKQDPEYPMTHAHLMPYWLQLKQPEKALFHAKKAEKQCGNQPQFSYQYGLVWLELNKLYDAANQFSNVLAISPDHYGAIINLSLIKILLGEIKQAETMLLNRNQAVPNEYNTLLNLGFCNEQLGQIDKAIDYYQQALDTNDPNRLKAFSGQLFLRHYQWECTSESLYKHHSVFASQVEIKDSCQLNLAAAENQSTIHIGYVSPDFRNHPVGSFIYPILKYHHRDSFKIFCYSTTEQSDEMTARIKILADQWVDIRSMSNEKICKVIQQDRIQILVDLAGHTKNNCIEVFAMKPAPIQVSYLGYPGTTGISQIDYRITDKWADPPGREIFYAEKLIRMPHTFLCFDPEYTAPSVADLPAKKNQWITFGSFNRISKLNDHTFEMWSAILNRIQNSRLILKTKAFSEPMIQIKTKQFFEKRGIEQNRLLLLDHAPTRDQHLNWYNHIDIALDTYPYHGTTTTCQALWMGVPVITLEGQPHVSRASVSILQAIGLQDCIAQTADEYIDKAVLMASDLDLLGNLRQQLRSIMHKSPLCQSQMFVDDLEKVYQWMIAIQNRI